MSKEVKPKNESLIKVYGPLSQQQVARLLGISRARVWQIEQKAMAKLRRRMADAFKDEF